MMRYVRQKRRPIPPVRVTVQRVSIRDGRVVLTCIHPRTGQIWSNVGVLEQGGADDMAMHFPVAEPSDPTQPAIVPETSGATQGWLTFDRDGAPAYQAAVPRSRKRWLVSKTPMVDEEQPHPGTYSPADFAIINGQGDVLGRIIVDRNGNLSLISDNEIRIQVTSGSKVRIFSGSDSNEPVVKMTPALDALNAIIARVNLNTAQLRILSPPAHAYHDGLRTGYLSSASAASAVGQAAAAAAFLAQAASEQATMVEIEAYMAATGAGLDSVGTEIGSGTLNVPKET